MLRKDITYTDFNGVERTEPFYFNLSKSELIEMEFGIGGGLSEMITRVVNAKDQPTIIKVFKELILKAYGEKSPDGKYFHKSEEISNNFSHTNAYVSLFMELATDERAAADFVNGIIPKEAADALKEKNAPLDAQITALNNK